MKTVIYSAEFAGHTLRYCFLKNDTHLYFGSSLSKTETEDFDIRMSEDMFLRCRTILGDDLPGGYIECKGLISLTSQYLLRYNCCIFHSVSFIYKDQAWLLTAPSGTGKTTQYRNWKRLFPEEITMISGDMPLLEMTSENTILVHPTPWNGKENIGTKSTAPLGGIIYLKQGTVNHIEPLQVHKGIVPIFRQFRVIKETEQDIKSLSRIIECVFKKYPVWKYTNLGNDESTLKLRETIQSCSAKEV